MRIERDIRKGQIAACSSWQKVISSRPYINSVYGAIKGLNVYGYIVNRYINTYIHTNFIIIIKINNKDNNDYTVQWLHGFFMGFTIW